MVDESTRTAWRVALETAVRDRDRANATISFFAEKLGMASPAELGVLEPGETDESEGEGARNMGPIQITDGEFYDMSQPNAAIAFLERAGRSRPQRTEAIMAALKKGGIEFKGKNPAATFYTILARHPAFHNVGKSTWGLSAWYPGASKKTSKSNASAAAAEPESDSDAEQSTETEEEETATDTA
jgi:hypothetical protein